jgi:hypothetical protein
MNLSFESLFIANKKGDVLRWLFDAAQAGNFGAIAIFLVGMAAVGYTLWESVIKNLVPKPQNQSWARWRKVGIGSVIGFLFSSVAFCFFIRSTIYVFFAPILFGTLSAWCSKNCGKFCSSKNSTKDLKLDSEQEFDSDPLG